jgi:SAM-dependent methyltransferase
MSDALELAQAHWNETPLYVSREERYGYYPWLHQAAEFDKHRGEHVLEIGCGTGCDLLEFARNGAIATGVDITEAHLRLARQRVAGMAEVLYSDARSLNLPHGSFDYVYSHGVLHHSDQPERIASEILRVLKPGGRFNIHVYALWSVSALEYVVRYGRNWKRRIENSEVPVHIDLYTASRLQKFFNVPITITKRHCRVPFMERWAGWYLIATGHKR